MFATAQQLRVDRSTPQRWRVTFDHPPLNLIDPDTIRELDELVTALETDPDVRVVVFDCADPDYFLAHCRVPVVSIAAIRGRARGAGSEFVLACDLRFASRERAILGQPEVSVAFVPGGACGRTPRRVHPVQASCREGRARIRHCTVRLASCRLAARQMGRPARLEWPDGHSSPSKDARQS
jgi:enoyl-CoA hydratase/carnithine racemase